MEETRKKLESDLESNFSGLFALKNNNVLIWDPT